MMGEHSLGKQVDFVNDLQKLAFDYKFHAHLICHIRKLESPTKIPTIYDLKGSGSIADQVDNAFIVWRHHDKAEKPEDYPDAPDVLFKCVKNRHGEWTGGKRMFYGPNGSYQFVTQENGTIACPGFSLDDRRGNE